MDKITRISTPPAAFAELPYDPAKRYSATGWQFERMGAGVPDSSYYVGAKVARWEVQDLAGRVYQAARCPIDHTSHHYRASIGRDDSGRAVALIVQQYHGGGHSAWTFGGEWPAIFDAVGTELARYLLADHAVQSVEEAAATARAATRREWSEAAASGRIKTRSYPARGVRKVWIEPARLDGETDSAFDLRKRLAAPARG